MSNAAINWALKVTETGLLKSGEAHLLLVLANYADNDDWSCYPDQETLAKVTAQGKRTVARHLKTLSELGLVLSESRYGAGRGRIGNMYYLVQDVQLDLDQNKKNARDTVRASKAPNRENPRSAKLALESENRTNTQDANMASNRLKCHSRHDSDANYDSSPQVPLKDHARINHQINHQSSDAYRKMKAEREATHDDDLKYLGVEVGTLFRCFPELEDFVDEISIQGLIDTVLGRARARVANPTAYVRRALETDFYGLALQHQDKPASASNRATPPEPFEVDSPPQAPSSQVPCWDDVPIDADPCVNPDHWESLSPKQFSNCPQCRIERRIGEQPRHVSALSDETLHRYPAWLREWAEQARAAQIA